MQAVDSTLAARGSADAGTADMTESYVALLAIARDHGAEEIKHLTRAYQAMSPAGGGRMIDLTAIVG